ncbi:MAG: DUF3500 domain-containing protein [Gammaproteobacteria bacterium]|nr:DUF3500 domain-containing protein [Gammaproteobacteria bacterium]
MIRLIRPGLLAGVLIAVTASGHGDRPVPAANIAEMCRARATAWLASLDAAQKARAQWAFDSRAPKERYFDETERRRKWHYLNSIPTVYQREEGLALQDMTDAQRILAHQFIQCGLSSQGYAKAGNIMVGEKVGWETLPDEGIRQSLKMGVIGGAGAYWLAVFGDPADGRPWQWQVEGHHLALNFTFNGDRLSESPAFLGTRPTVIEEGQYAGWHLMGYEKERAFRLMRALDPQQKKKVLLQAKVVENIFTDPNRLHAFDSYQGLPASALNKVQRQMLLDLIREYVANYEHEIERERMAEIERQGLGKVHFAWMGPTNDIRYPIYFRVHGPSVLIEYVNAVNHNGNNAGFPMDAEGNVIHGEHNIPDSNHIHSVYRRPGADFGDDLLREHYMTDPAHRPEGK